MPDLDQVKARLAALCGARAAGLRVSDGEAALMLDVTGMSSSDAAALESAVEAALLAEPGIGRVRIAQTARRAGPLILAVGSGKGGVGKSTVSANLAIALARRGIRVGLVDADIYGPSQPRLLGLEGTKPEAEDGRMRPVPSAYGVPLLSLGQLVPDGQAVAWRGPMAGNALSQLIDAHWEDRELLVVDLPPGTGDILLSMVQKHRPHAAILVSTPQDLAWIDAARAAAFFATAQVPVLGLVENMAGYACPHCGKISDPFGTGGAATHAAAMDIPLLARIMLSLDIRTASDAGTPPAAAEQGPDAPFAALAGHVAAWLSARQAQQAA